MGLVRGYVAAGGGRGLTLVGYEGSLRPQERQTCRGVARVAVARDGCSTVQVRDGGRVTGAVRLTMS